MNRSALFFGVAVFFLVVPHGALAASAFQGTVASVSSCYGPAGYAFTLSGSSERLIFRPDSATALPAGFSPTAGAPVFVAVSGETTCDVNPGPGVLPVSGKLVSYLSNTARVTPTPTTTPRPASSSGASGGSGISTNQITSLFSTILGGIGGTGSTGSGGGIALPSGGGFSFNRQYGGRVLGVFPCTCVANGLGRDYLLTLGPPNPGIYFINLLTVKKYAQGFAIIPGTWHLGKYRPIPGICWMQAFPVCVPNPLINLGVITEVGTSLPGI